MNTEKQEALIDTDFLNHVSEIKRTPDEIVRILSGIFVELALFVMIHPFVYKHEIIGPNETMRRIFDTGLVRRPELEELFYSDPDKVSYYTYLVPELYKKLTGDTIPLDEVFTFWKSRSSLGEVHSVSMCLVRECGIFLSDDGDSKKLKEIVKNMTIGDVNVYSREDLLNKFACGQLSLNRAERKAFIHKL